MSDPAIARVDSLGHVFGLAPGVASVTASLNGQSKTYSLGVRTVRFERIEASSGVAVMDICGITTDGGLLCWGRSAWTEGVQTDLTKTPSGRSGGCAFIDHLDSVPAPAFANTNGVRLVDLQMDQNVSCGLDASGNGYCWGDPSQLYSDGRQNLCNVITGVCPVGVARAPYAGQLVQIAPGADIAMGQNTICAVTTTQSGVCWGRQPAFAPAPVPAPAKVTSVRTPRDVNCFTLGDGHVWCTLESAAAGAVARDSVLAAFHGTCALARSGAALCYEPGYFRLDDMVPGHHFISVDGDWLLGCGLEQGGDLYCWGDNQRGELGTGTTSFFEQHGLKVAGQHVFRTFSAGASTVCAVDNNGVAYCWGVLPDGSSTSVPRAIAGQG